MRGGVGEAREGEGPGYGRRCAQRGAVKGDERRIRVSVCLAPQTVGYTDGILKNPALLRLRNLKADS